MAGVTTDVCLVFPAISAHQEDYQVQAVMDASGSPFEISEEMSRRRMEREGVMLTATNAQADPMHTSGARTFTIRPWLLNDGKITIQVTLSEPQRALM